MLDALYHSIDPIAFSLGPFNVRWYGLAYVCGFAFAAIVVWLVSKHWKLRFSADDLITVVLCAIVGIICGARLGYCLFYGDGFYFQHPLKIFAVYEGGMSFHGGLIGALLGGIVAAKLTKIPYLTLIDLGVIAASLGLFFGRCANFANGELWGSPTDLPWGVSFGGSAGDIPRHPSQLYEGILEGLVTFLVLIALAWKVPPRPRGIFAGTFLLMYGVFRIAIEFVREPDAQLGYLFGGWLTMGMLLSVPLVLAGIGLIAFATVKKLPEVGAPASKDRGYDSEKADSVEADGEDQRGEA